MALSKQVLFFNLCVSFLLLVLFECRSTQEEVDAKYKKLWYKVSPEVGESWIREDSKAIEIVSVTTLNQHENLSMKKPPGVPGTPDLKISGVTNTTITVQWKMPDLYKGSDPTYKLRWTQSKRISMTTIDRASRTGEHTESDLEPFTLYQVQIQAQNEVGPGNWSKNFETKTRPGIPSSPENLRVDSKSSNHIEIEWDVPDPPYGIILRYRIQVISPETEENYKETDTTHFMFTDLAPYTEYQFMVCASTEAGWGDWSDSITVTTEIGVPSVPLNLSVVDRTSDSIEVQWMEPEHKNAPYVVYVIRWIRDTDLEDLGNVTSTEDESFDEEEVEETTSYHIQGLQPYTNYSIQVCAKTDAGRGNFSEPIIVQTKVAIPGIPKELKAMDIKSTEITIKWTAPEVIHGPLEGYEIRWGVEGTIGSRFHTPLNVYQALGLRPYTEYFFQVSAKTEEGIGPPHTIYKRTNISIPSVPRHFEMVSVTDHCILLQWDTPENPNAPHVQYSVQWSKVSKGVEQSHDTNNTSYRIRFLDPLTNYSIRVSSANAAGLGPATRWLYIQTKNKDRSTVVTSVSVVSGLLVVLVIGGVALFYFLRRKNTQQCKSSEKNPETSPDTISLKLEPRMSDSKRVSIDDFDDHILKLMSNGYYKLAQEYEQLGRESSSYSADEAKKNDNLTKNRWIKVLPFDYSRVKLLPVGDEVEPDYINASYVPGDSYMLEYIAAQGPLQTTVDDFWRMVWQESVFLVVMLTQCVERAKRTCETYWPSSGASARYGALEVKTVSENIGASFTQRLFLVAQDGKQRHIVHLHYMKWPVSGCPKSPDDFLNFVQTVRSQKSCSTTGPLLVHCSAGIGRTGTFIAVDRLSQQLTRRRECEDIDVYGTVLDMRRYRRNLVQTEEQYYFIYLCLQRLIQQKRTDLEDDYGGGIYAN